MPVMQPMKDLDNPNNILPQELAYNCKASIIGYGGSAGGGKSALAVLMSLMRHTESLIIRRTFPNLIDLINKVQLFVPNHLYSYNDTKHVYKFLKSPRLKARKIQFFSVNHEKKIHDFQGQGYSLQVWDEVTQIPYKFYEFITTWNRKSDIHDGDDDWPAQRVLTFNPPTSSDGEWVIRYFGPWCDDEHPMYPYKCGDILYITDLGDGIFHHSESAEALTVNPYTNEPLTNSVEPKSITFFRATVNDNIYYRGGEYANELKSKTGPMYRAMFLGDMKAFLGDSGNGVIKRSDYVRAVERGRSAPSFEPSDLDCVGTDVALGGNDSTVFSPWYGKHADKQVIISGIDTPEGRVLVKRLSDTFPGGSYRVCLDSVAVGADALSRARDMFGGGRVLPFIGSKKTRRRSKERFRFINVIQAAWFLFGEALADPDCEITLPYDPVLQRQLCGRKIKMVRDNIIVLESKAEYIKRTGESPDRADALIMGWWGNQNSGQSWLNGIG